MNSAIPVLFSDEQKATPRSWSYLWWWNLRGTLHIEASRAAGGADERRKRMMYRFNALSRIAPLTTLPSDPAFAAVGSAGSGITLHRSLLQQTRQIRDR